MLTTGIAVFGHSITEIFLEGCNHLYQKIKSGVLDQMLVRPQALLFQVICSDFELTKTGRLLESIFLIIYGLVNVNINWTLYKLFVFLLIIFGVILLFSGILILKAAFCFWTIDGIEFMNIIQEGGRDLSSYPISIYRKEFAFIFTFVIPFGMINYYPLLLILERQEVPFWYGFAPLLVIPFFGAMLFVWDRGIKSYKSTGS